MAYRSRRKGSSTRRSYNAPRRRRVTSGKRRSSVGGVRRRASSRPQTVRLVIEQAPPSLTARPEHLIGVKQADEPRKAKF